MRLFYKERARMQSTAGEYEPLTQATRAKRKIASNNHLMGEDVAYIDHKKIMTHKSLSKFRAMNDHTKIRTQQIPRKGIWSKNLRQAHGCGRGIPTYIVCPLE